MFTVEKIINGYVVEFKNTDNKTVKVFFPSADALALWIKSQFEAPPAA
jgi:hypothetical protein